ncbi:MAG TPA: hypothetical protein VFJ96_12615 [Gemmatimonadaceae bacterium]|nr:hypothetical protein [Gemmatimonadaceae bacterium]
MTTPVLVAWSGGKDSMLALHDVLHGGEYRVAALLTTVTEGYERISIHGVRRALLRAQTDALGLPLLEVRIPQQCSNAEYEARMNDALAEAAERWPEATSIVHGDIFLEDVRQYRETMLARRNLRGVFPLWGTDTGELARAFLQLGYKAVITCVDTQAIPQTFAGREFDESLLRDLPSSADPCGENGEFHTFVYDGPLFAAPVAHRRGDVVLRDERFAYADLLEPAET